ncbi:MAG: hypothetical protein VR78_11045 [Hoeflea sp. BRH_c9]|nr:MAG: hypothetical protein VR78_11045 [Hoeflea sp. BRH_c9]
MTNFSAKIGIFASDNTSRAFASVANNAKGLRGALGNISAAADNVARRSAAASAGAMLAIAAGSRQLIANEGALTGVVKTQGYDGAIEIQKELQKEIGKTGLGLENLNAIASQLSTSGITDRGELVAITATSAAASKAFDVSGEAAASALSTFRGAFGANADEIKRYADNLNYLADGSNAQAGGILEANRNLSPLAASSGVSPEFMTAMSATALNAGFDPSVASTGMKNTIINLQAGTNATKAQQAAFKELGITAEDTAKSMTIDADKTIIDVLGRIAAADPGRRSAITTSLFGKESSSVVALINDYDGLVARQAQLNSGASAGSMDKELANLLATRGMQILIATEKVKAASAALAGALAPMISMLADKVTVLAEAFEGLSKKQKEWAAWSVVAVAALAPVAYGVSIVAGAIRAVLPLFTGIGRAVMWAGGAIGGLAGYARAAWVGFTALRLVMGGTAAALGVMATGPIGLAVLALTTLASVAWLVYENWGTVTEWLSARWKEFGIIGNNMAEGLVDAWAGLSKGVSDAASAIGAAVGGLASSFAETFPGITAAMSGAWDGLAAGASAAFDATAALTAQFAEVIKGAFTGISAWVGSVFTGIFEGFKAEVSGLLGWLSSLNPLKGAFTSAPPPTPQAQRGEASAIALGGGRQVNAVLAQPEAKTVTTGGLNDQAAAEAADRGFDRLIAKLSENGTFTANVNVKVAGGQVTGVSQTASGLVTAGNVGVQELGAQ